MKRYLTAAVMALCLTCEVARAEQLPVDQLWEIDLEYSPITLGTTWAEDGAIHLLTGGSNQLREIVDGRVVNQVDLEQTITAIDRGDADQAEGVEVLVAVKGNSLSELLVLDGVNFELISRLALGNHRETKTTGLAWLEESASLLVVRSTYEQWRPGNNPWLETRRSATLSRINLQGQELGQSFECGTGSIKRWRDDENNPAGFAVFGRRSVDIIAEPGYHGFSNTLMLSTLNPEGRAQYSIDIWSGGGDIADYQGILGGTTIAPLPDGSFAAFEALDTSISWINPGICNIFGHQIDDLDLIEIDVEMDAVPHSLAWLPPEASVENRSFLMCAFRDGTIRLFDLSDFQFNQQEFFWEPGSNQLMTGDFDENGQTELLGLSETSLTCARIQQLGAETEPAVLVPSSLSLSSYPNPFNSSTTISYSLPKPGRYALSVVDITGREVARLGEGWREAGSYREIWDGNSYAQGMYFARLKAYNSEVSQRLLMIK